MYSTTATKRATNLSVNSELLRQARELNINLSATLESALAEAVRAKRRVQWLADNQDAITRYNEQVDAHGVFSDGLRAF